MDRYASSSYGDAFADVYDEWYGDLPDTASTVALLERVAEGGPVLELGVGTGRLALPLAGRGLEVHGIDASEAMLDRLRAKPGAAALHLVHGDMAAMAGRPPQGPFRLVFAAYNTLFNLPDERTQADCFAAVCERLVPGGRFLVEAFVPEVPRGGPHVGVREVRADRVVLNVSIHHPDEQRAEGQMVELSTEGGVRLRPWAIRYATPDQLDQLAEEAGLIREERWEDARGSRFTTESPRHVTVYRQR